MRLAIAGGVLVLAAACTGAPATSIPPAPSAAASASAATSAPAGSAPAAAAACTAPAATMVELTEGPYYKAGAPQRTALRAASTVGTPLVLTGYVVNASCQPIGNAKLDFWQADGAGNYDNSGYNLRGWQLSDANGGYRLETVIPGLYPGRTEHIHVKLTVNGKTFTSQLFFPGVAQNEGDSIYSPRMLVKLDTSTSPATATFTFVVNA
jgi:protocatechuate 3,4-dioxygenase beta subunit